MKQSLYKTCIYYTIVVCFAFGVTGGVVYADTTVIHNTTNASASTGGQAAPNAAQAGEVVEGESRSEVYVETTVNGETIESVHETATGTGSAEASVSHTSTVNASMTAEGEVHTEVKSHTQTSAEQAETGQTKSSVHSTSTAGAENAGFSEQFTRIRKMIANMFSYVFSFFTR